MEFNNIFSFSLQENLQLIDVNSYSYLVGGEVSTTDSVCSPMLMDRNRTENVRNAVYVFLWAPLKSEVFS